MSDVVHPVVPTSANSSPCGALDPRAGLAVVAAGALLVLSEIVERVGGGLTRPSYAVTIAAFTAIGLTAWIIDRGQRPPAGRGSLIGAALLSAGALLEALADVIGFGEPTPAALQAATGLMVPIAGVLLVTGAVTLGVSALRARVYPRWAALAVSVMPLFLPATTLGLPIAAASVTNMILGIGIAGMGLSLVRRATSA
jgi:hypothetical protein